MIQEIINSALAPFMQQVGWQGFAYGLLGIKTIKRTIKIIRDMRSNASE